MTGRERRRTTGPERHGGGDRDPRGGPERRGDERRPPRRPDPSRSTGERLGVLVLNFGEPVEADERTVEDYLERIFRQNQALDPVRRPPARGVGAHTVQLPGRGGAAGAAGGARALARARAPGLLDVYRRMGPSPLNAQADAQACALEDALRALGRDARAYSAFQFTPPTIPEQVRRARADGATSLVALPLYPLCGRSTTVAALESVREALDDIGWAPRLSGIGGWHHHPTYVTIRVDGVRSFVEREALDLRDADTLLHFSVHGTPVKYLDEGSRYDRYVAEHCRTVAHTLGVDRYAVGFQNHTNRRIEWTNPDNEDRIREARERRLVVVPISFVHEQSETLAELDIDLRAFAEELGKEVHRVPVPHDDARFPAFLAGLVEGALTADGACAASAATGARAAAPGAAPARLTSCRCHPFAGTWCTNGHRVLPPSPYAGAPRA